MHLKLKFVEYSDFYEYFVWFPISKYTSLKQEYNFWLQNHFKVGLFSLIIYLIST